MTRIGQWRTRSRVLGLALALAASGLTIGLGAVPAAAAGSIVSVSMSGSPPCLGGSVEVTGSMTEFYDGLSYDITVDNPYDASVDLLTSSGLQFFTTYASGTYTGFVSAAGDTSEGQLEASFNSNSGCSASQAYGAAVATLSSVGTVALSTGTTSCGVDYNFVSVTVNSNLYDRSDWTVDVVRFGSGTNYGSGGSVGSTSDGGSTSAWTTTCLPADALYEISAVASYDGASTAVVQYEIAGTPAYGSDTASSITVNLPSLPVPGYGSEVCAQWPGPCSWTGGGTPVNTTLTLSGLSPNTEYNVADYATDVNGGNTWWQGMLAWTQATAPGDVSLRFHGDVPEVSWSSNGNPASPDTSYRVQLLNSSGRVVQGPLSTTGLGQAFTGVCGDGFYAEVEAENGDPASPSGAGYGQWTSWVASATVGGPNCLALSLGAPTGLAPGDADQLNVTVADAFVSSGTVDIYQEQLGPTGAQVDLTDCPSASQYTSAYDLVSSITLSGGDCLYALPIAANGSTALTTFNQQHGGPGYVYKYWAVDNGSTSDAATFANAPTFYVHRRTQGLVVDWPDEGNGARYEVFGGPGGAGCNSDGFNSGLLPAGSTQWTVGALTPNTEYSVCLFAQVEGQPVTPGGGIPQWWVSGGDANSGGMWYTLPQPPGQATVGGLLAGYYDVPSLDGNAGPSEQVFGNNSVYTAVQGPIDFSLACNCTSSWPYAGYGGPLPETAAGGGTGQFFAIKFLGWVDAPASGTYTFNCRADDACQVWVNGGLVVDAMQADPAGASPDYYEDCQATCMNGSGVSGSIDLSAGWLPIEVDYTQGGGGAGIDLTWITPSGGSLSDVPAADLAYPSLSGAAAGSDDNVTLSWAQNADPTDTAFDVDQEMLSPGGSVTASNTLCAGTTADVCTTSDLTPGSVSGYRVVALSGDGYPAPATTEPGGGGYMWADAPAASVTVDSPSSLAVDWSGLGNGSQYAVIWNTSSNGVGASTSGGIGAATSDTISGLQPNTSYYVWVDAWIPEPSGVGDDGCTGGSGGGCSWVGASPFPVWTLASGPTNLLIGAGSGSLSLSWGENGNPAGTSYDWSVAPAGGSTAAQSGSTTNPDATATGLVCQSTYTAQVAAINGAGVATSAAMAVGETGLCSPPPKVGLEIDNGLQQTSSTAVTLDIQATDANYAQSQLQMRFSNDGNTWAAWRSYASTAPWTLTGSPGPNTVYVEVQDPQSGLGSTYATISYDSSVTSLATGGGTPCTLDGVMATCTNNPIVSASFSVPAGSVSMETSRDNASWSQPRDAAASVQVILPSGDGLKAVFARYFNQDNVATPEGPDYFVLDTTPPVIQSVSWLNNAAVTAVTAAGNLATLVVQASDDLLPVSALEVTVGGAASWSGELPSNGQIPLTLAGSGYVTVTVTIRDQAGNSASTQIGIMN